MACLSPYWEEVQPVLVIFFLEIVKVFGDTCPPFVDLILVMAVIVEVKLSLETCLVGVFDEVLFLVNNEIAEVQQHPLMVHPAAVLGDHQNKVTVQQETERKKFLGFLSLKCQNLQILVSGGPYEGALLCEG